MRPILASLVLIGCGFDSSGASSSDGTSVADSGSTTTDATSNPTTTASTSTASSTASTTMTTDAPSTSDPDTSATDPSDPTTTTVNPSTESDPTEDASTGQPSACDVDNGGCDPDASCSDMDGVKCTCNGGFIGDGLVCVTTPVFPTLRADLPCTGGDCFGGATCYTDDEVVESVVMTGEVGILYDVTLAVRGVLEQKEYDGDCDGLWCVGGDPDAGPWNAVTIEVSDPPGIYHPNAGMAGLYEVFAIDYERTIPIAEGATITVTIDGDNCSIDNGQGIVIPDVPPDPDPFDGQFLQLDLVGATIAP